MPEQAISEAAKEWEPEIPGEEKVTEEIEERKEAEPEVAVEEEVEPQKFNIIVIGTDRDSRNTFIHTLSGEEGEGKEEAVLNFGRIIIAPHQLNLYGLPGAKRFAPLWQTFVQRVQGMILLANGGIEEELNNMRFALSLLGPRIPGPKIVVNTDPTRPEIDLGPEIHGVKILACLPSDRPKAEEITSQLLSELLR